MKAKNIIWDTDGEDINLPSEIDIPDSITDPDEISNYLSDQTGFCHKGYELDTGVLGPEKAVVITGMELPRDCWCCGLSYESMSGATVCAVTGNALYPIDSAAHHTGRDRRCPLTEMYVNSITEEKKS